MKSTALAGQNKYRVQTIKVLLDNEIRENFVFEGFEGTISQQQPAAATNVNHKISVLNAQKNYVSPANASVSAAEYRDTLAHH